MTASRANGSVPTPAPIGIAAMRCSGIRLRPLPHSSMSLSASSEPNPDITEDRTRGRRIALVILALCAAPTVAAWLAYVLWQPQPRLNHGELIEARSVSDPELRRLDGSPFRLAQGKDAERIERMWLLADATPPDAALLRDHEGLRVARAPGPLLAEFPAARGPYYHIYLLAPLGNLMLRFPTDPDAQRMVKDLARLLRASRVG